MTLNSLLIECAKKGSLNEIKNLIGKGANDLDLALQMSAVHGHLDVMKFLVANGANINICKDLSYEHKNIVEFLVAKGINARIDYSVRWNSGL